MLFLVLCLLGLPSSVADCPCTSGELSQTAAALANVTAQLQNLGVDTHYEQISLATASYFTVAIASDTLQLNGSMLLSCGGYLGCNISSPPCRAAAQSCAAAMLCNETCGAVSALNDSIAAAIAALASPSSRVATRTIAANASTVTASSGFFRDATGSPTMLGGMNWFPSHGVDAPTVTALVANFTVSTMDVTISPGSFQPNASGIVSQAALDGLLASLNNAISWGMRVQIYVDHTKLPPWAPIKFPGLTDKAAVGKSHFVGYDIDNPGFNFIYGALLSQVAAAIADHPAPFAFLLANEPMFPTAASNFTLDKYTAWLATAYRSDIASLNTAWGSSFESFTAIDSTHLAPAQSAVSPAEWYDWCMFNQARVTAWFKFMADSIASTSPGALTEAKFLNENLMAYALPHSDGIDREAMLSMLGMSGCDTRLPVPERAAPGSSAVYAISWLSTAVSHDFSRSLQPHKAIYDSEWHDVTDDGFFYPALPASHVSVGLWLSHLHGLAANQVWFWGRAVDANVSINSDAAAGGFFAWSLLAQPQLLDAYSRTLVAINTFAAVMAPFASMPRNVVLLYSEASAIQSQLYRNIMISTYEATYFLGNAIGFVTDASLSLNCSLTTGLVANTTLIVPSDDHVLDATVACLSAFAAAGGHIVFVGNVTGTPGGVSLSMTGHGKPRNPTALAWVNSSASVTFLPVPATVATAGLDPVSLMPRLQAALNVTPAASTQRPARCVAAGTGVHALGVMCRAIQCVDGAPVVDGTPPNTLTPPPFACNATLFVMNVMNATISVDLQVLHEGNMIPAASAYSVLNNSMLASTAQMALQPLEYLLVLV